MQRLGFIAVLLASSPAAADLRPQVQADLGLTVINAGYEQPIGEHWALQIEGGIFGTYFLPWFELGDDVTGINGGTRVTWFARSSGRGPYVAPYLRVSRVKGEDPDAQDGGEHTGFGIAAGVFVGWAFGLTDRIDLRIGAGAQYIYLDAPPLGASTPFVALDLVVGYRL
ncbi:MAG: DUF3575 domain-containing protein [Deltaproteobacteria bacterium]|nr:DUF3575 domain-containing protein [Deltaproteobacteria bacterium]